MCPGGNQQKLNATEVAFRMWLIGLVEIVDYIDCVWKVPRCPSPLPQSSSSFDLLSWP